jgi:hypothetical protein
VTIKPVLETEAPRPAPAPAGKAAPAKAEPKKVLDVALIGTATDERPLLEMRDRLGRVKGVSDLKTTSMNASTGTKTGREVRFSLSYRYTAPE